MNKTRISVLFSLLLIVITVAWTVQSTAYERYNGTNNCSQCHSQFIDRGPLHDTHTAFVPSCTDCHGSIGDNPLISKCAECHTANPLWVFHVNNAPADGSGLTCATCHTLVPNDTWSWGDTKANFR